MQDITDTFFWDTDCLNYFAQLHSVVWEYKIEHFATLFSEAAVFGAPGCYSLKSDVRPRWNSVNQFLTVAIKGKSHIYPI